MKNVSLWPPVASANKWPPPHQSTIYFGAHLRRWARLATGLDRFSRRQRTHTEFAVICLRAASFAQGARRQPIKTIGRARGGGAALTGDKSQFVIRFGFEQAILAAVSGHNDPQNAPHRQQHNVARSCVKRTAYQEAPHNKITG